MKCEVKSDTPFSFVYIMFGDKSFAIICSTWIGITNNKQSMSFELDRMNDWVWVLTEILEKKYFMSFHFFYLKILLSLSYCCLTCFTLLEIEAFSSSLTTYLYLSHNFYLLRLKISWIQNNFSIFSNLTVFLEFYFILYKFLRNVEFYTK